MAYREMGMWGILEVLRRVHRGEPQRAFGRVTGHSRTTIRRWVAVAVELGWVAALVEPDEALAVRVAERARPVRRDAPPGERPEPYDTASSSAASPPGASSRPRAVGAAPQRSHVPYGPPVRALVTGQPETSLRDGARFRRISRG